MLQKRECMKKNANPLLIFDYDGTLHHTIEIYEPSVKTEYQGLVEDGLLRPQEVKRERIAGWLGKTRQEMWEEPAGNLPLVRREAAAKEVATQMKKQIEMGHARWYPGVREVLDRLKQDGYPMVILSNCSIVYKEANWKGFQLERWFQKFYDCESYGFAPKTEIIKTVLEEQAETKAVVIGDRDSDLAAARAADGIFIGCRYGFGSDEELKGSDLFLNDIRELPEKLRQLS